MNRPLTIAATITAVISICLLCLVGICLVSFAAFGLSLESTDSASDGVAYGMAVFFICMGIFLPVVPIIIGALTYFFAKQDENTVAVALQNLSGE